MQPRSCSRAAPTTQLATTMPMQLQTTDHACNSTSAACAAVLESLKALATVPATSISAVVQWRQLNCLDSCRCQWRHQHAPTVVFRTVTPAMMDACLHLKCNGDPEAPVSTIPCHNLSIRSISPARFLTDCYDDWWCDQFHQLQSLQLFTSNADNSYNQQYHLDYTEMTYEGIDDDNSQVINAVLELPDGDFNVSITGVHDWNGSGNLNLSITDPSDDSVIFTTSGNTGDPGVSNGNPQIEIWDDDFELNSCLSNDACGVCGGDDSTCLDECGVPNGDNSSCSDCAGVPNGTHWLSDCGCVSADSTGDGCDDGCGVPNGDNSTCADECGVPYGDNTSCDGCMDATACNYDPEALVPRLKLSPWISRLT